VGWIIVVVIVAVAGVVGWVLRSRSRKARAAAAQPEPARASRVTDATPMTGLEVALDQATDRSGRNMRDKIESGTAIDDLIVPDDTGPILRRALDHVEHAEPIAPAASPETAPDTVRGPDVTAEPAGGETPPNEG
jgi:hypothetical protein